MTFFSAVLRGTASLELEARSTALGAMRGENPVVKQDATMLRRKRKTCVGDNLEGACEEE